MEIEIKDTLTLDDGCEYVVVSKVNYESKIYLYLVNEKGKMLFCLLNNESLKEIKDEKLIAKLIPLFLKNSKMVVEE